MLRLLMFICVVGGVLGNSTQEKCKFTDKPCLLTLSNRVFLSIFTAEHELDPMHEDKVEGTYQDVKFVLTDNTIKGIKDCKIEDIEFDFEKNIFTSQIFCPLLNNEGKYVVSGNHQGSALEGNGKYTEVFTQLHYTIINYMELIRKEDGTHIRVNKFEIKLDPRERVVYKFDNLYHGGVDKAAAYMKTMNENDNWKEVAIQINTPIFIKYVDKIVNAIREFFDNKPMETYFTF